MKFLFPYSYAFATRAKGALNKVSFFAIFAFPLFLVTLRSGQSALFRLIPFFAAFTALICVYEMGYLQNDICTTRKEENPTIRLPLAEHEYAQKNALLLICVRVLFLSSMLLILYGLGELYTLSFLAVLLMLLCVFGMHNTIRGKANAVTYLLLCFLKYAAIPILFLSDDRQKLTDALVAVFFAFVLPRSMEHASKPKYNLRLFRKLGNHDLFRLRYYGALSYIACIAWYFSARFSLLGILALWFLGFRALVVVALSIRKNMSRQNLHD